MPMDDAFHVADLLPKRNEAMENVPLHHADSMPSGDTLQLPMALHNSSQR